MSVSATASACQEVYGHTALNRKSASDAHLHEARRKEAIDDQAAFVVNAE